MRGIFFRLVARYDQGYFVSFVNTPRSPLVKHGNGFGRADRQSEQRPYLIEIWPSWGYFRKRSTIFGKDLVNASFA